MNSASQNYFLGTLLKTPLKVYFAGSSAHVAIKEAIFLLSFAFRPSNIQDVDVLSSMLVEAVMIYIPAHKPATVILNFIIGIGVLVIWTLKYERATSF